jgi:lysosomal alpha-mannosidase
MNLDKLIKHANAMEDEKVHIMYSTPSCYLKTLQEANEAWPIKDEDFFPFASDPHAYWTGYYSSRPTSKRMIREASGILQAAKQITAKRFYDPDCDERCVDDNLERTEALDQAVGICQHHDAITGLYIFENILSNLLKIIIFVKFTSSIGHPPFEKKISNSDFY